MEACGDNPEDGFTSDYVPTLTTGLDDAYDAELIAGDDTDFIDTRSSVNCSLYMGERIREKFGLSLGTDGTFMGERVRRNF